jgi:hypothetical protein
LLDDPSVFGYSANCLRIASGKTVQGFADDHELPFDCRPNVRIVSSENFSVSPCLRVSASSPQDPSDERATAVHGDYLAGDEGGAGAEEEDGLRDVVGIAVSLERDPAGELFGFFGGSAFGDEHGAG